MFCCKNIPSEVEQLTLHETLAAFVLETIRHKVRDINANYLKYMKQFVKARFQAPVPDLQCIVTTKELAKETVLPVGTKVATYTHDELGFIVAYGLN